MIQRILITPVLITTALFAQGFGGQFASRRSTGSAASRTAPTPAQLAAAELTRIARFLRLDSSDTSKLTGNASLVGYIETEQSALLTNAATLKTAYSALATDIATNNSKDAAVQQTTIQTTVNSGLQVRVTAAGQVTGALPSAGLSVSLTPAQLTSVARLLIGGERVWPRLLKSERRFNRQRERRFFHEGQAVHSLNCLLNRLFRRRLHCDDERQVMLRV